MEVIGGLAFLGQYFNGRKDKQVLEKQKASLKKEVDTGDIYSREYFTKANKDYENLIEKNSRDSQDPDNTGVIPKYYNFKKSMKSTKQKPMNFELFTETGDDGSECQSCSSSAKSNDPDFFIKSGQKMSNNRRFESKITGKKSSNNEFLRQFDDMRFGNNDDPTAYNGESGSLMNSAVHRLQNERDLTVGYSTFNDNDMTYGVVGREHFTHNNMQPFFKKTRGGLAAQHQGQISQRNMELFTGSVRDDWQHKKESGPRFSPIIGFQNIYGTPVMTDYYESRYISGKERRNELPFQQIKVAPGLGLGTKGGHNSFVGTGDLYRVLPQTLPEQLRPTKPKASGTLAVHNVGQKGSNGPIAGSVEKRRPDQFVKYDPNNMVKTGGNISAPRLNGEIQYTGRWRGHSATNHIGPAEYNVNQLTTQDMRAKQRNTSKQSFKQSGPTNVYLYEGLRGRSNKLDDTYIPDPTQRGQSNNRQGVLGRSDTNKSYTYDTITNIPDPTRRQFTENADRQGVAVTGDIKKGQAVDPNDVLDYTLRDIHNQLDRSGVAIQGDFQKGQAVDPNDVPEYTLRDIHNQYDRTGKGMTGEYQKGRANDPNDVPEYTLRDIYNQYDRTGKGMTGEYQKGRSFNLNDVLDWTLRDIHNKFDRNGKGMTGEYQKGRSFNPNDVLDWTLRDIYNQYDRNGKGMTGEFQKGRAFNPNDVLDLTLRDLYNQPDRIGKSIQGGLTKGKAFNPNDVLDLTLRDIHNRLDRSGVAIQGDIQKNRSFDPNDVLDPTIRDQTGYTNRRGVLQGEDKGYTINYTNATPDQTIRDQTGYTNRRGTAGGTTLDEKGYVINYVNATPDITIREQTGYTNRRGTVGGTTLDEKGYVINYADATPDVTIREQTGYTNRRGTAKAQVDANYTINYADATPDITIREQTGYTNRRGTAKSQVDANYTINYVNATPDITIREQTGYTNRRGTAKSQVDSNYVINYVDATPDITIREQTGYTNRANPAKTEVSKEGLRMNYDNATTNTAKEKVAKGRTPTQIKYNVGPINDLTQYNFKPDDENQIRRSGGMGLLNQSMDRLPQMYSKNRNDKFYVNDRSTAFPQISMVDNPYVNNIINKTDYDTNKIKKGDKIIFDCDVF
jgi:hypothetical protein